MRYKYDLENHNAKNYKSEYYNKQKLQMRLTCRIKFAETYDDRRIEIIDNSLRIKMSKTKNNFALDN